MENNFIEIGKVVNTHALKGEIKIQPWCDDPALFDTLEYINIGGKEYEIERTRLHKNLVIAKLFGVDSIEKAEALKNSVIEIERSELGELPEGVYYICDLIGCRVETDSGVYLGKIEDVIKTGSNDVYSLTDTKSGREILIPVLPETIISVNTDDKIIKVKLLKGLVNEDEI